MDGMPGQQGVVPHVLIEYRGIQQPHGGTAAIKAPGTVAFRQDKTILIGASLGAIHHRHIQRADDVDF
ncbi:hypothetical protein D3C75_1196360 [compost metagenome]